MVKSPTRFVKPTRNSLYFIDTSMRSRSESGMGTGFASSETSR
jgi:hypothetical protein